MEVTSTLSESVRLTVRFGESLAFDVRVPATDAGCSTQPVYRYGYRLAPASVVVKATSTDSEEGTARLHAGSQKRWLVVQVQEGFPVDVREWTEGPAWG
jgi:hypothetical protein